MAQDLHKYFRIEAREILDGLGKGVLQLEKGGGEKSVVSQLLRQAHTLKGASRVVKEPGIAELAHSIEEILAPHRDTDGAVPADRINQLFGLVDLIAARLGSLDAAPAEAKGPLPPASEELAKTVRVEIDEMDALLDGIAEVSVQLTALRRSLTLTQLERVESELAQVRDASHRLRLVPAASLLPSLERAVRDAAQTLDKKVDLGSSGGDLRLDARVLAALRDALLHVVRNAVVHGIEPTSERAAAGKAPAGRIELSVERRGNRLAFVCRDDGRGIDVEAVRTAAVRRGLLSARDAAALGVADVLQLILRAGVTTAGAVSDMSGRGIGLDVVAETAAQLKGEVAVKSEPGRGTTIEISVPVSLSSLPALAVDGGGITVSVPLDAVCRTLRVSSSEVARSADRDSIVYQGQVIPFLPLAHVLKIKSTSAAPRHTWSAVVLQAPSGLAALGVDRLLGTSNIVVRPVTALAQADRVIGGASLDAEGNPRLVLDADGVVAAAHLGRGKTAETTARAPAPILIIDDSLTTRMLEQSILESAGYRVDLATSAEEGLAKAQAQSYGLFLVDVEMPGMDGFDFVAHTQSDAGLRHVPSVLVTSRNAPEDRRRGEKAGARAYIVKGEFDQVHLLNVIGELIGLA